MKLQNTITLYYFIMNAVVENHQSNYLPVLQLHIKVWHLVSPYSLVAQKKNTVFPSHVLLLYLLQPIVHSIFAQLTQYKFQQKICVSHETTCMFCHKAIYILLLGYLCHVCSFFEILIFWLAQKQFCCQKIYCFLI